MITFKTDLTIADFEGEDIQIAMVKFLRDYLNQILFQAQKNLVAGTNQITGQLLRSGRAEVDEEKLEGEVVFSAPYAAFVEFGTDKHAAPLGKSLEYRVNRAGDIKITEVPNPTTNPLDYWSWRLGERAGIQTKYGVHTALGFAVWIKILVKGTDPHPFLRPALDTVKARKNQIARKYGITFE